MATATQPRIKRSVHTRIKKADDLELHVSLISVPKMSEEDFVEVRDFVPSRKTYGRGVVVPSASLPELLKALGDISPSVLVMT